MIILDATNRTLEIDLNAVVTTNQLPFVASYVDMAKTTMEVTAAASNTGASNSTTAVTLVAAPGANQTRQLKYLSIRNADTVATLLWVQMNDNSTLREIWKGTLAVGDSLVYTDAHGWYVLTTSGSIKSSGGVDGPGLSTDNAIVRWDGTGGTAIQNSGCTIDDSNNATIAGTLTVSGASITASSASLTIGSTFTVGTEGKIALNGSGLDLVPTNGRSVRVLDDTMGTVQFSVAEQTGNTFVNGTLTVSGAGPHAIGGGTNADYQIYLTGTFAGAVHSNGLRVEPTLTVAANGSAASLVAAGTLNKAGSGTHADFASVILVPPTIGAGAATLTNASTLKINAAPTGATNNYALWVDAGTVRIDGTDGAGAGAGTLGNAPTAGNPAFWLPINSNGTTYYIPCWT